MTEVSARPPTIEEIGARIERLMTFVPPGEPPGWLTANLTFGQLRVLFLLRDGRPVSIGALAERLAVSLASASETIDRIERHELVVREHRADDRRVVECRLSERGVQLLADIAGVRLAGMRRMLGVLTPTELTDFDRLIRVIATRLEAAQGDAPTTPTRSGDAT
jgi:DNA-binding MarR family transcriptional regulator